MGDHAAPQSSPVAASGPGVVLALGQSPLGPWYSAPWILPLVILGSRVARFAGKLPEDQLVVALTLPTRDYAAILIGCGWVAASPAPRLEAPDVVVRELKPGTPIRLVTDQYVETASFTRFDESSNESVIRLGGQGWQMNHVRAVAPLPRGAVWDRRRQRAPLPGTLSTLTYLDRGWSERLCCPTSDLALVGTVAWLRDDLNVCVGRTDQATNALGDQARGILLPKTSGAATWSTRIYPTAAFSDELDRGTLPKNLRAVILDGASAAKALADIEVPVVVAVIDRSVADESAQDALLTVFRGRGTSVSMADLCWHPPAGVEALAFTVPL
jgi:hypothetical protein